MLKIHTLVKGGTVWASQKKNAYYQLKYIKIYEFIMKHKENIICHLWRLLGQTLTYSKYVLKEINHMFVLSSLCGLYFKLMK